MSHGDVITRSTYLFIKGSKLIEVKPFFHRISPQDTMYIWENLKKTQKTIITSNNRFLLMLGEYKSDQLFVEKTKLANNLYVENVNHLS